MRDPLPIRIGDWLAENAAPWVMLALLVMGLIAPFAAFAAACFYLIAK